MDTIIYQLDGHVHEDMNYPCQTMLHTLKFHDVLESNIVIKGIAIVKSTANKSSCNSFGDRKR